MAHRCFHQWVLLACTSGLQVLPATEEPPPFLDQETRSEQVERCRLYRGACRPGLEGRYRLGVRTSRRRGRHTRSPATCNQESVRRSQMGPSRSRWSSRFDRNERRDLSRSTHYSPSTAPPITGPSMYSTRSSTRQSK